jgi:exodeoxyribonuclease VII small subunit
MAEESYSFAQARLRLEEIVSQVRKKDVSLEKSLDLLEEGVRLANQCTELIDHADWDAVSPPADLAEVAAPGAEDSFKDYENPVSLRDGEPTDSAEDDVALGE